MKILKLLLPMLCGLCFFCYSTVGGAVPVAADNAGSGMVQLTAQQTLALYGRQLHGYYYNKNDRLTYNITFNYAFTKDNWNPYYYTDSPTYIFNWESSTNNDGYNIKEQLEDTNFLVYYALATPSTYPLSYYQGDADRSNVYLDLPFSVELSNITAFDQYFMWSNWYNYDRYPAERSYVTNNTDFSSIYRCYPQYHFYSAYDYHQMSLATFPWYPAPSVAAVPDDEDRLMYASVIHNNVTNIDDYQLQQYDLSNQSISMTFNDKYDLRINPECGISWDYTNMIDNHVYALFFFISCPKISTVNPLPPLDGTTSPVTGTGNNGTYSTADYETFPTVDLSALESGVGTMVQQIGEGNYYERIQIDQLNTIIQQLNDIYAQMVARGEIAVDLVAAGSAQRFDTSILDQVQNAATSYTISQLPQDYAGNGATGIGAFIAQVVGVDPIFMTVGIFSIGFAIFCWFVFRGRGGV